jgi:hypothetical protein
MYRLASPERTAVAANEKKPDVSTAQGLATYSSEILEETLKSRFSVGHITF